MTEQEKLPDEDVIGILTNTAYIMSQATDLILREAERRLAKRGTPMFHETKQKFNRWTEAVKRACILNEDLTQDIYKHESKRNYKDVQIWQEQENEMARLALLFADISPYVDFVNEIFKHLRSFKGEGIVTEELLSRFYLKKL